MKTGFGIPLFTSRGIISEFLLIGDGDNIGYDTWTQMLAKKASSKHRQVTVKLWFLSLVTYKNEPV